VREANAGSNKNLIKFKFNLPNLKLSSHHHLHMEFKDSPTNYSASSTDSQSIHDIIRNSQQELQTVDEEVDRLNALLRDLHSRQQKISAFIHEHRQLVFSPIRRIPSEILAEIFFRCLPAEHLPTRSLAEAPLLVTLVCKEWRETALNTPRMWSSLHVFIPDDDTELAKRKNGVERWLELSGNRPLTLSLTDRQRTIRNAQDGLLQNEPYSGETPLLDFIRSLISQSFRWKDITLNVPYPGLQLIASIPHERIPILQRVAVHVPRNSNDDHSLGPAFCPFLRGLPQLSALYLHDASMSEIQTLTAPWNRLTKLTLIASPSASLNFDDALGILSQSQNLRICKLSVSLGALTVRKEIHLPHLTDLSLWFSYSRYAIPPDYPVRHLSTPALSSLSIACDPRKFLEDSIFPELVTGLLSQPNIQIRTLCIAAGVPLDTLLSFLQLVPRLESLTIGSAFFISAEYPLYLAAIFTTYMFPLPSTSGTQLRNVVDILSEPGGHLTRIINGNDIDISDPDDNTLVCPKLNCLKLLNVSMAFDLRALLNLARIRQQQGLSSSSGACSLRTLEVLYPPMWLQDSRANIPEIQDELRRLKEEVEETDICIAVDRRALEDASVDNIEGSLDSPWEGLFDDETAVNDYWKMPTNMALSCRVFL
jgi:hypothetical protein